MNFGNHLRDFFQNGLPECDQTVVKKAMDYFLQSNYTSCIEPSVCRKTKFLFTSQKFSSNEAGIGIYFQDPEIEYHHTSINYDLLSLFGEIGGVLGLTLGLSTMSLIQFLIQSVTNSMYRLQPN